MEIKNMKAHYWVAKLAGVAVFGLTMATSQHTAVANVICTGTSTSTSACSIKLTATVAGVISLDIGTGTAPFTNMTPITNSIDFGSVDAACTASVGTGACMIIQDTAGLGNGAFMVAAIDATLVYAGGCAAGSGAITIQHDIAGSTWPGGTRFLLGIVKEDWSALNTAAITTAIPTSGIAVPLSSSISSGFTTQHQVALQVLNSTAAGGPYTETLVYTGSCI